METWAVGQVAQGIHGWVLPCPFLSCPPAHSALQLLGGQGPTPTGKRPNSHYSPQGAAPGVAGGHLGRAVPCQSRGNERFYLSRIATWRLFFLFPLHWCGKWVVSNPNRNLPLLRRRPLNVAWFNVSVLLPTLQLASYICKWFRWHFCIVGGCIRSAAVEWVVAAGTYSMKSQKKSYDLAL